MKTLQSISHVIIVLSLLAIILCNPKVTYAQDSDSETRLPENVYIELTRDFYESLKDRDQGGERFYSNDPSIEYLKEISISSRFMVETNLQILKQQERILQLLQTLLKDKKK